MTMTAKLTALKQLVQDSDYLGAVIQLDYDSALVATTDFRQISVGGVPQNCFLTVIVPSETGEIAEVVLLSVSKPEPMMIQRELIQVREDLAMRQATDMVDHPMDDRTQIRLGTQALRCKVVGTFYEAEDGRIRFGADVDNVRSATNLKVFRPSGAALAAIASFSNNSVDDNARLEIGKVRYSETRRHVDEEASVYINVSDFIGTKTALFGMTRSGKSNSMKTLLQKVHQYSHAAGKPVAQLIFDPQGEYANLNSQDGDALADIGGPDEVAIYKIMEKSSNPKEKYLQFDLFAEANLELTYNLILAEIRNGISSDANYIAPLFNIDMAPLGENATQQEKIHYRRKKLGLFALMFEGLRRHPVKPFSVNIGEDLIAKVKDIEELRVSTHAANEVVIDSTSAAAKVVRLLLKAKEEHTLTESWRKEFEEGDGGIFFDQIVNIQEKGRNGVKAAISRIEELHSADAEGDVRQNVWEDITLGKLIVVDLARGSNQTSQILSELIVNYLLDQASERFISGEAPIPFQIVVEEAHNLFERDSKKSEKDPWVRISKEASKYQIGLVYATQEISSVDKRILSNTSNFLVSALNSIKETNELANYYHFADWAEHIRRIETKGFARFKTQSSPYIIPVQIEKFVANVKPALKQGPKATKSKPEPVKTDGFEELEF